MSNITIIPLMKPMLAVKSEPFDSSDYLYEVKWDGYRLMAYLDSGVTELRSRNQLNITSIFPELSKIHRSVERLPALLDGEVVIFIDGKPSFKSLQSRGRLSDPLKIAEASRKIPALYIVFDILYYSGKPVYGEPLIRRKEILAESVSDGHPVLVTDFVVGTGVLYADAVREQGLEGVMSKMMSSPYLPGKRSPYWKKLRNTKEVDLGICGYQVGKGGKRLGSLLLCAYQNGKMIFTGKVGTGFTREIEADLIGRLQKLQIDKSPVEVPHQSGNVIWVKPDLVCIVEYFEKTADGYLRHPSFKGLRFDKGVWECVIDQK